MIIYKKLFNKLVQSILEAMEEEAKRDSGMEEARTGEAYS